jgi:hypothetical protein
MLISWPRVIALASAPMFVVLTRFPTLPFPVHHHKEDDCEQRNGDGPPPTLGYRQQLCNFLLKNPASLCFQSNAGLRRKRQVDAGRALSRARPVILRGSAWGV